MNWIRVLLSCAVVLASNVLNQDSTNNDMAKTNVWMLGQNSSQLSLSNSSEADQTAEDCYESVHQVCPENVPCAHLDADCLQCSFNTSCVYGSKELLPTICHPRPLVNCTGSQNVTRFYQCRYCYQLERWQYRCNESTSCSLLKPRSYYPALPFYTAVCQANASHYCLGRRCFYKQQPCNWSRGYKWSTALILSITLGGFGIDRFYLGLWKEGMGKLFSFGGLGVWTIVDVILIAVGYVGPQDGSLYI